MTKSGFGFFIIIFLILTFYLFTIHSVLAFQIKGPAAIVPTCGTSRICTQSDGTEKQVASVCSICDIFALIQNILNFIVKDITIPLAALFMAYGGVLMILPYIGGSTAMHDKGKKVILQALTGILIIFFAWLGIDTIIKVIASPYASNSGKPGIVFPDYDIFFPWNEVKCGNSNTASSGQPPLCEPQKPPPETSCDGIDCTGYVDGYPQATLDMQESEPPEGTSIDLNEKTYSCTGVGFDQPTTDAISAAAQKYGVSTARIKAIIIAESSGNSSAIHADRDGISSYGLMQIRYDTATQLSPNTSSSDLIKKLYTPMDNVDLGTKYFKDLHDKYGSDDLASAAYNGGPDANKNSVNCASEGKKRWQCEWDDNAHTLRNERSGHPGYGITRDYVSKTSSLEQQINSGACNL